MNQKLKELLTKINFDPNNISYFEKASIERIIVHKEKNCWDIYLKNDTNIPFKILKEFLDDLSKCVKHQHSYELYLKTDFQDDSLIESYYCEILHLLSNKLYYEVFCDRFLKQEDGYYIEVYNKSEENFINKELEEINSYFKKYGFDLEFKVYLNEERALEIKDEITKEVDGETSLVMQKIISATKDKKEEPLKEKASSGFRYSRKEDASPLDPNVLFGRNIKGDSTPLSEINYEIDNITVEVQLFGVEAEQKRDFYIITLKMTDFHTSMYGSIFLRDEKEYIRLSKALKAGMWVKVNGYVKNNNFRHDLVLNVRSIEKLEKVLDEIVDDAEEKRVELHTHTTMSQMDGVVSLEDLIKQAKKWGHKAIAITDHNAIQTFPLAAHYNEGIKILYGVELAMIDDEIDLVKRADTSNLLDNTYVVFDFETTGFNAGGGDSIIEIGAVKIKNGEIIERFDKFCNPHRPLPKHIVELTNITDEMLKDAKDEEEVVKEFIDFCQDLPMVAHNAKFDSSFLEMAYSKYNLGTYTNPLLDTLQLSRALDPDVARHSLSALVKRYDVPWDEDAHHRADYDAEGTAYIFHKMLKRLEAKQIKKMSEIDLLVSKEDIHKFGEMYHLNILVKNQVGLKNLFKLVSYANSKYLYKTPRILRSEITKNREGLLIGSGCANGEIFTLARSKSDEELEELLDFYDYVEVQPLEVYRYLIDLEDFKNEEEIKNNIKKIIRLAKKRGKIVVVSGDVHHLRREDKIYREIIINQKVPGGGRHPLNRKNIKEIPSQHFRTTKEMLEDFSFLDKDLAYEIVVTNTNKIADMISDVVIVPDTKGIPFSPRFENSVGEITDRVYNKAHEIYGEELPEIIQNRIESELSGIIKGGFDSIYLIAQKLVAKSNSDGYNVGSRGSVGSSFVATMLSITEVNPLPAHYVCPNCKKSLFEDENGVAFGKDYPSGFDLPDKVCSCGTPFRKDGQDMPFATFLGFNADKVPDIDLNFSGDYQAKAHEYTKVLFGEDHVYRAGTIGTVAEKTAYGFVKGYYEDRGITDVKPLEIERLAIGVTGVKRTTGQHPGGIVVVPDYKDVFDFTPYQYPADDTSSEWLTTHFNYHDIESCLLKLDILGHDNPTIFKMLEELTGINPNEVPMDDKEVMSLFSSTKALGVTPEQIGCEVGCLGLPEFTKFVIGIVLETKPTTFAELVKISGLSHGTDVWNGNAQDLVRSGLPFKEVIGCRDDIMVYLMNQGLEPLQAFKIMEFVRKGKASKDPEQWAKFKEILKENKIADWYIDSCGKIKYMFPKAHATAYVTAAWRIAWFKINKPLEYYATYFSIKSFSFDLQVMEMGYDKIKEKLEELNANKFNLSVKEQDLIGTLEIALEASARGIKFGNIDLKKSHSRNFVIDYETNTLIAPFRALDGLGETVANTVVAEREKQEFISIDDLQKRGKLSSTLIEKMRIMGILQGLPESSQLSLFDGL